MNLRASATAIVAVLGVLMNQNIFASDSEEWNFEITPYFLAAGLDGKIGLQDATTDVDMSFSDIWDQLDAGFMGMFSARKGRWTLGFEAVYFKLSGVGSTSVSRDGWLTSLDVNGALELTSEMSIYSGTVAYRVLEDKTQLDVLGALRYTDLEAELEVSIDGAFTGVFTTRPFSGARKAKGSKSWTDAVVGLRVIQPVSDEVDLVGYVDVGGSDDSTTWQAIAGVNWEFKEDYTAKFGYRVLDWDYDDGDFKWDMQSAGLYAGLGIAF
mgnify:FL=1